ncbi:glycosyltransferase family 2 protein [uncultured Olegusella sp.]|uniref:glycosyltransferase family 2 protein n=1 Tax=uncultured Olegusella sp. TaxID=1979846 RepID=UPI00262E82E0|nr:glycosyltransferase family 2 protein [uncultured Olegusella sp.]
MKTLVVIPAYNEEDCLLNTIQELISICPNTDYLIFNDGSTDQTAEICDKNQLNHIDMPINTGLSSVFRAGMKYAFRNNYDAVVQFDADGQHVPSYIPLMEKELANKNCDIVLGSRYLAGEKANGMRNVGSRIISWLIKKTTSTTISDPTCGLRIYNRKMIKVFAQGFDIEPEPDTLAFLIRNGATISEVPITVRTRQGGESYLKPLRAARYMLRTSASLILFIWSR